MAQSTALTGESAQSLADTFYSGFDTDDGANAFGVFYDFSMRVPDAQKSQVLELMARKSLAQRTPDHVVDLVMAYIITYKLKLTEDLKSALSACRKSKSLLVRHSYLHFISDQTDPLSISIVRGYLQDENDNLRGVALCYLALQKDGRDIIVKFIKDHEKDPAYEESITRGKLLLKANDPASEPSVRSSK